jgi:ubiquinone/menaquinone biosynthesis C-methylase UbiE
VPILSTRGIEPVSSKSVGYDAYQTSFHEAFRPELYRILDELPIPGGAHVLDVPCGNGFYSRRLIERLGSGQRLIAVDANDQYLSQARQSLKSLAVDVQVRKGNAYQLPFEDQTFDLVWCAQSLISLDPRRAVREMQRVTKREGLTVILEVDEFHHILLPWPVALEAALLLAIHKACIVRYGDSKKLAPVRRLRPVLAESGFHSVERRTYAFDRAAPFDAPTLEFLEHHLAYLKSLACPHLPKAKQNLFDRVADLDNPKSPFRLPNAELVCINAVYFARPAAG